jgi:asparagine synthase (glutamine-hydrolysing)
MCGITGFINLEPESSEGLRDQCMRMASALRHRGPDDAGVWVDQACGVALGHRRLSILDLSPLGHQPMVSAGGRYVISFNGEIYNYLDFRSELEKLGHKFKGTSDTEILLGAIEQWGLKETLENANGMFAIALWDREERRLSLTRDRFGEKPLYFGWSGKVFTFGSELKAMRAHPKFRGEVDRNALALYFRHNYVPAPHTIYQGIYKVLPGWIISICPSESGFKERSESYWSLEEVIRKAEEAGLRALTADDLFELEDLLRDSVKIRMQSDVPLGAMLSGGIDSSTITALMQAQSSQKVKTFTIGFGEGRYNEAPQAKAVAQFLGTDHTEMYVSPQDAMAVIPSLPSFYDEPFSDSSQLPTYLVSVLAKQKVTVALSGDGGDEVFGGYSRYLLGNRIWKWVSSVPRSAASVIAQSIRGISPEGWSRLHELIRGVLPPQLRYQNVGEKMHTVAGLLHLRNQSQVYLSIISHWRRPEELVVGAEEPATVLNSSWDQLPARQFVHRMMYLDTITYLPDDILTKVDRASMAVSLECRVPFLDPRVVSFAWKLGLSAKLRNGQGKWILRQILNRYVPKALIERPKMGFGVPLDHWLRGPLKEWAEDLLSESQLRSNGILKPEQIRRRWLEHGSGKRNWQYLLWDVLMFQAWLKAA